MVEETENRAPSNREGTSDRTSTGRRKFLKKGLLTAGVGAMLSPTITTRGSADLDAQGAAQFEIWAADHIEIDYRFQAEGPVEPIAHPADDIGAEIGPNGNDIVEYIGDGIYRGRGRTGYGKNDLWRSGTLDKIVITDCRE